MLNPQEGDVITLSSPTFRPQYLNGAKVKIERIGKPRRYGSRHTFEGELIEMQGAPRNGRFRVGRQITGITHEMIHDEAA